MILASWLNDLLYIGAALLLVALNGFFVAAEFALVKIRPGRLEELVREGRPAARTGSWLVARMESALSACQLGITMASLGLGWIGEPAFARLLEPLFRALGVTSVTVMHTVSFIVAFVLITSLHLVVGEQAPKIYAIRKPETMLLWCAAPMKFFYVILWPFLVGLKKVTEVLLRKVGIVGTGEHEAAPSEREIRTMLSQAHAHGDLSRSEHRLLHAVFEFDDLVARRVMVPRADTVFLDVNAPVTESLEVVRRTQHTRYPVCDGSLDRVIGIAHIKDLVWVSGESAFDLRTILRPPHQVPETIPISRLLRHFQATHHLLALVVDEHGTMVGFVTLENVLEAIVGPVEDEFDSETPRVVEDGPGRYLVRGGTSIDVVNSRLGLDLYEPEVDTLSGLLVARTGRLLEVGDRVELDGATAEVVEVAGARALRVAITKDPPPEEPASPTSA